MRRVDYEIKQERVPRPDGRGLALEGGRQPERFEERFAGVDVLLVYSDEQQIVVGIATDLVAALDPDADGVDSRECERPITEPRGGVRLLARRRTDAGVPSD